MWSAGVRSYLYQDG